MSAKNASAFIGTPRIIFGFVHMVNELLLVRNSKARTAYFSVCSY